MYVKYFKSLFMWELSQKLRIESELTKVNSEGVV